MIDTGMSHIGFRCVARDAPRGRILATLECRPHDVLASLER